MNHEPARADPDKQGKPDNTTTCPFFYCRRGNRTLRERLQKYHWTKGLGVVRLVTFDIQINIPMEVIYILFFLIIQIIYCTMNILILTNTSIKPRTKIKE